MLETSTSSPTTWLQAYNPTHCSWTHQPGRRDGCNTTVGGTFSPGPIQQKGLGDTVDIEVSASGIPEVAKSICANWTGHISIRGHRGKGSHCSVTLNQLSSCVAFREVEDSEKKEAETPARRPVNRATRSVVLSNPDWSSVRLRAELLGQRYPTQRRPKKSNSRPL